MRANIQRMWINQPSTLQRLHDYHGTLVLAEDVPSDGDMVDVWFVSGDVISARFPRMVLSYGWPEHLQEKKTS